VDVYHLGDLNEFLSEPAVSGTSVDATHLQGNPLVHASLAIFKKPVGVFSMLNPPDHAPFPVLMDEKQRDGLCAVLRDAVVVV
jgi:hypothetical protein